MLRWVIDDALELRVRGCTTTTTMPSVIATIPSVIAICGAMRSGKDAVASYLERAHGYRVSKIAAPLKAGVCQMFGFTPEQLETDAKDRIDPRWGVTPRAVMQIVGTDLMQGADLHALLPGLRPRGFWIEALLHTTVRPSLAFAPSGRLVISDLRFEHEVAALRVEVPRHQLLVMRVVRPNICSSNAAALHHRSEQEHQHIAVDVIIDNDADIAQLHRRVELALLRSAVGSRAKPFSAVQTTIAKPFSAVSRSGRQ